MISFSNIPHVKFHITMYGFKGPPVGVNIGLDWLLSRDVIINLKENLVTMKDIT